MGIHFITGPGWLKGREIKKLWIATDEEGYLGPNNKIKYKVHMFATKPVMIDGVWTLADIISLIGCMEEPCPDPGLCIEYNLVKVRAFSKELQPEDENP